MLLRPPVIEIPRINKSIGKRIVEIRPFDCCPRYIRKTFNFWEDGSCGSQQITRNLTHSNGRIGSFNCSDFIIRYFNPSRNNLF